MKKITLFVLIVLISTEVFSQNISLPRVSQYAQVTQRLGLSDVTITYNSPGVKKRKVFGNIVPYGTVWRAGANENTTITFSDDAMVEGQKIAAGTYGLHILPNKEECSILFSKYHKAWGSGSLKEADVVLKVNVKPQEIPFREWLSFNFNDRSERSLTAALEWEKTSIPFKISFDIDQVVLENARQELKGTAGFGWQGYMQIAGYCADNDVNLEEAMAWIDESISKSKEFSNLEVKSRLLEKKGKTTAAEQLMKEAIALGNGYQLNFYGYQLMRKEKVHKAIEIFAYNVKKNQDHQFIWGFTDSLAEAYLKAGDKKKALKYYQLAKTKAPENQHKYLDGVIADIKSSLP